MLALGARGLTAWRQKRDSTPDTIPFPAAGMAPPAQGKRKVLLIGWDAAD